MSIDFRPRRLLRSILAAAGLALLPAAPLAAQSGSCGTCTAFSLPAFMCTTQTTLTTPGDNTCPTPPATPAPGVTLCNAPLNTTYNRIPKLSGPTLVPVFLGNGQYKVRLLVHIETPFNTTAGNGALQVFWSSGSTATSPTIDFCNQGVSDTSDTYLEFGTFTCANVPQTVGTYSMRAQVAQGITGSCCTPRADLNGMTVTVTPQLLGCPVPRKWNCDDCKNRKGDGHGGGSPAGKGGVAAPANSGPGAMLRYAAGGAGGPTFPGSTAWNAILGRYWSHDYAERIVIDPITNNDTHVWMIAPDATFREFTNLSGGIYQTASPSDEYRKLYRTASGWELHELDGTVHFFDGSGLWARTVDRAGNAKVGTYTGGKLGAVTFPDGRGESFTYYSGGKLATITEAGVGGAASRVWQYTWSASNTGNDLTRIDRPDGTAWEFFYTDATHPGWMTRMDLVGADGSRRVDTAWEYDANGNTVRLWRGDPSFTGSNAVEKWSFSFDTPTLPATTAVTDPLGQVSTYTVGRDTVSDKPRFTAIVGDCPSYGLTPNEHLFYDDPAHPLRPTRRVDGRGTTTSYAYNSNGLATSRTEAVGTPLARTTTWEYGGPFPALVTRMEQPSTSGTGARATAYVYDGAGNPTSQTVSGVEAGSPFSYTTAITYNGAGRPLTTDPPGYGTQDVTSYTYDPSRGSLFPLSRTDPAVGTTAFSYDSYNRATSVTDPNGVATDTAYDNLNRALAVTQRGAMAAGDLVTANVYNTFGDLFRVIQPRGNVIEYSYDAAGRLVAIEGKPDASTSGQRVLYTLDGAGNHTREEKQRWNGSAWVTDAFTNYVFATRCHLDKAVHPDATVTEFAYDAAGKLARIWDAGHPSGNQANPASEVYTYDVLNRLTAVAEPWGGGGGGTVLTQYLYDAQDHQVQATDPNGTVTSFVYSDRDLVTRQTSEVSGVTTYVYNEHGAQVSQTDARGVTVSHTLDARDRVTLDDYPNNALDTTYVYDDPGVAFSKGRLTAVTRNGQTVAYTYDRFGRTLQDGELSYTWDPNGNRQTVTYPGGVTASYTFDFADRPATLSMRDGTGPVQALVGTSSFAAFGPLSGLTLGNGLTESHPYDARYFPAGVSVPGRLDWAYTTDAMGNVTAVTDNLNAAGSRAFTYQDTQYFLTQGNGPWGTRSWSYDKTGNRLSETRNGVTDAYVYASNAASGSSPRLVQINRGAGGASLLAYDPAGELVSRSAGTDKLRLTYGADQRLSQLRGDTAAGSQGTSNLTYDGRSFLAGSTFSPVAGSATPEREATATYDSMGLLYHRSSLQRRGPSSPRNQPQVLSDSYVFYFAGQPVALFEKRLVTPPVGAPTQTASVTYLTTDHLGTPVLATNAAGAAVWQGGLEPFGEDWNGAQQAGVFLRLPGQWVDPSWDNASLDSGLSYNVNRWYAPETGQYTSPDPVFFASISNYAYALDDPTMVTDPLGLAPEIPPGMSNEKCLFCTAFAESRGRGKPCYDAVASVILNRLDNGYRGATSICEVTYTKLQFSSVTGPAKDRPTYEWCIDCFSDKSDPDYRGDYLDFANNFGHGKTRTTTATDFVTNTKHWVDQMKKTKKTPVKVPGCTSLAFYQ
jgi:RHS repeat-associated protein